MNNLRGFPIIERIEARSIPEPNSGCWLWTAGVNKDGYGKITLGNVSRLAHRVSWEATRGAVPDGVLVCHKCDVRSCVNPGHLFLGNQLANMRDMHAKRRHTAKLGEQAGMARLTSGQVQTIRLAGKTDEEFAADFGVSKSAVTMARLRYNWKHIP